VRTTVVVAEITTGDGDAAFDVASSPAIAEHLAKYTGQVHCLLLPVSYRHTALVARCAPRSKGSVGLPPAAYANGFSESFEAAHRCWREDAGAA